MLTTSLNLLIALGVFQQQPSAPEKPGGDSTLERLEKEICAVAERVRPSVVQVIAVFPAEELSFSGVVYSLEGHVITDASGLEQAVELRVTIGDRTYTAVRLDADRRTGVAVLKVAAKNLAPATLAAAACKPGAAAIVVGNAFGFSGSVSFGSVQGVGRSIMVRGRRHDNMVQVNAAVQPGDCGGFVADLNGSFVGLIHSAYAVDPQDKSLSLLQLFGKNPRDLLPSGTVAVGFATPAAWVKFSADRIIKHGRMVRGWLGAGLKPLDDATRTQLGLAPGEGAEVTRVDRDSPARRAGLNPRDILVAYDGEPVKDLDALQWKIAQVEAVSKVKTAFIRNRERLEVDVQIEIDPQK